MQDRFRYRVPVYKNNEFDGFVYLNLGDKLPDLHGGRYGIAEQCSGLQDKNGKLIYEGDIIYPDYVVERRFDGYMLPTGRQLDFYNGTCEVIGNIHENQ